MRDIVERLRIQAIHGPSADRAIVCAAADEIEQLRHAEYHHKLAIDRCKELEAEVGRLRTERDGLFGEIAEASDFLDALASRLDPYMVDPIRNKQAAAECRTMAAKLRGET